MTKFRFTLVLGVLATVLGGIAFGYHAVDLLPPLKTIIAIAIAMTSANAALGFHSEGGYIHRNMGFVVFTVGLIQLFAFVAAPYAVATSNEHHLALTVEYALLCQLVPICWLFEETRQQLRTQ